jgi:peptidoglycan/LPS O-acetylase OafA/YrhL
MKFDYLATSGYWFDATPPTGSNLYVPLAIAFGILFLAGLAIALLMKGELKKIWGKYAKPLLVSPILVAICLFARYEQLPWLASRFALMFVLTGSIVWILTMLIWSATFIPEYKKEKKVTEKFNQYLPKAKSR